MGEARMEDTRNAYVLVRKSEGHRQLEDLGVEMQ
jgi:hypothetical protein